MINQTLLTTLLAGTLAFTSSALAKGLDEISEASPENQEAAEQTAGEAGEGQASGEVNAETKAAPSETSKALADKLVLSTSFGWASASHSEGDWKASGMSDILIGFRLPFEVQGLSSYGTFRYAPVSISGEQDEQSYRGIWDIYAFGARFDYPIMPGLVASGNFELAMAFVYLDSLDSVESDDIPEDNQFLVNLGGGADWTLDEAGKIALGPRLNLGFGGVTVIQFAGAASFKF